VSATVAELYDALHAFEARRRGNGAYPVHKRLRLDATASVDIYDWVADRLDLRSDDRVLDVGCGVGFGTLRMAKRGVAQATGITVSHRELSRAREAALRSPSPAGVTFELGSFDRLPGRSFDVVVAVESVKHSPALDVTLQSILESMAPGGRGVIVEDLLVGDPKLADARRVAEDWLLSRLYTEADYTDVLGGRLGPVVDLTPAVRWRGRLTLAAELTAARTVSLWPTKKHAAAMRAFRGGLHLERLYATGAMRYKALFFTKKVPETP